VREESLRGCRGFRGPSPELPPQWRRHMGRGAGAGKFSRGGWPACGPAIVSANAQARPPTARARTRAPHLPDRDGPDGGAPAGRADLGHAAPGRHPRHARRALREVQPAGGATRRGTKRLPQLRVQRCAAIRAAVRAAAAVAAAKKGTGEGAELVQRRHLAAARRAARGRTPRPAARPARRDRRGRIATGCGAGAGRGSGAGGSGGDVDPGMAWRGGGAFLGRVEELALVLVLHHGPTG
jgi:hypothetical protein